MKVTNASRDGVIPFRVNVSNVGVHLAMPVMVRKIKHIYHPSSSK